MKIENLIPNNGKWKIQNGYLYVRYLAWLPLAKIHDEYIEIYLDLKLHRYIITLIKKLGDIEFYLISPVLHEPGNKCFPDIEKHRINILNMISNYANPKFYEGFQDINFDIITHLVVYCKKHDTMLLIKEAYDYVNNHVQSKEWNYYSGIEYHLYPDEIRQEFNGLYRQIKLAELLN